MVLLVKPTGDFPLNDDWSYGKTVEYLVKHGDLRYCGWNNMVLIAQVLWGALFCLPFGFSFTALRMSTLVLGGLGVAATYGLLREMKASRLMAFLGCLVMAANPIYFSLSNTFMTDIPFLGLALMSVYLLMRGLRRNSAVDMIGGVFLSILAMFIRQTGIVIPAAFGVAYLWKKGLRIRTVPWAAIPTAAVAGSFLIYQHWLKVTGRLPDLWDQNTQRIHSCIAEGIKFMFTSIRIGTIVGLVYLGLFMLPFLIAGLPQILRIGTRRQKAVSALVGLASLAGVTWWLSTRHLLLPFLGNIWYDLGLGPTTLRDTYVLDQPNQVTAPSTIWLALTIAGCLGGGLLAYCLSLGLATFKRPAKDRDSLPGWALVLLWSVLILYWAPLAVTSLSFGCFDRYLIPMMPFLMMLIVPIIRMPANRAFITISLLVIAFYGAFSVGATHDYMAWNEARYEGLHDLLKSGVPPSKIDGGFEYNGWFLYNPYYTSKRFPNWWWAGDDDYVATFNPIPGYRHFRSYPFRRWVPPGEGQILILKRIRTATR